MEKKKKKTRTFFPRGEFLRQPGESSGSDVRAFKEPFSNLVNVIVF